MLSSRNEYVVTFQVAMNDTALMQIRQALGDLSHLWTANEQAQHHPAEEGNTPNAHDPPQAVA